MKKDSNTISLQNAFTEWLNKNKMQKRFKETYIVAFWREMMGEAIASRTKQLYIHDGVLYVLIESASLRNELQMAKSKIIEIIERSQPGGNKRCDI